MDIQDNIEQNLNNSKYMIEILNEYILFFNLDNNSYGKTFFDGIDLSKLSSTNIQMEKFHEHITYYKDNIDNNKSHIFNEIPETKIGDTLYVIFREHKLKRVSISYSLFSVLIEIINLKRLNKNHKYFIKAVKI